MNKRGKRSKRRMELIKTPYCPNSQLWKSPKKHKIFPVWALKRKGIKMITLNLWAYSLVALLLQQDTHSSPPCQAQQLRSISRLTRQTNNTLCRELYLILLSRVLYFHKTKNVSSQNHQYQTYFLYFHTLILSRKVLKICAMIMGPFFLLLNLTLF